MGNFLMEFAPSVKTGVIFLCEECGERLIQQDANFWICPKCADKN
jgi:predicted RNA-binding Zn-ribbon protein involved in translation (DUF1610 family)